MNEASLADKVDELIRTSTDIFAINIHGNSFQRRGLPDRIGNVGLAGFYLELKAPGKTRTPIQIGIARKIIRSGGSYLCSDSFAEVQAFFEGLRKKALDLQGVAL